MKIEFILMSFDELLNFKLEICINKEYKNIANKYTIFKICFR